MSAYRHLPYRKGVGIMLLNARGEVFVAKRIDMTSEAWQMPQGGIDEGELPRAAALQQGALCRASSDLEPRHAGAPARPPAGEM